MSGNAADLMSALRLAKLVQQTALQAFDQSALTFAMPSCMPHGLQSATIDPNTVCHSVSSMLTWPEVICSATSHCILIETMFVACTFLSGHQVFKFLPRAQ